MTHICCVLSALDDAVESNIPKVKSENKKSNTPGWTEYVKPIQSDMRFWHSIWISLGKPRNSVVHNIYRHLRRQYIYAHRHIKKQEREIRNEKFLEVASEGNLLDILKTLRTQRGSNNKSLPNSVDNISGDSNVSEHFRNIYYNIYNVHLTNMDLFEAIETNISNENFVWLDKITPELVSKLIGRLNNGKNDQFFNFKSDGLKLSKDIISIPLAKILKAFLVHGYATDLFLSCSLIPLIKDNRKSKTVSNNYRLIAISSLVLKLMDLLMLELFSPNLKVSNMQFGFQTNSSTTLCSWTLKESINFFTNRGSPVYLCLLDMTKAFDHVKLDLLFKKLRDRMPGVFLRFLIYTYVNQQCAVKWNGAISSNFSIANGVRQGAVISPVLFNVYMDQIFNILKESNVGCKIDNFYYGVVGYADDFTLISPSRDGLQRMINLVNKYCEEHGIRISTDENIQKSKTKCICFNFKGDIDNIMLYNRPLPWVDSHLHLGHTINKNESSSDDIMRSRAEFISNIHALYQELGNTPPHVFLSLVQTYFTSFYGAVLWDLQSNAATRLYSTWNVHIRNAYNLPYATHRYILQELSNRPPLQVSFCKRFTKFCEQIKKSKRPEVLHLFHLQKFDYRSTFGKNYLNIILLKRNYGVNYKCPIGEEWRFPLIKELLQVQFGEKTLNHLDSAEIDALLVDVCCS